MKKIIFVILYALCSPVHGMEKNTISLPTKTTKTPNLVEIWYNRMYSSIPETKRIQSTNKSDNTDKILSTPKSTTEESTAEELEQGILPILTHFWKRSSEILSHSTQNQTSDSSSTEEAIFEKNPVPAEHYTVDKATEKNTAQCPSCIFKGSIQGVRFHFETIHAKKRKKRKMSAIPTKKYKHSTRN